MAGACPRRTLTPDIRRACLLYTSTDRVAPHNAYTDFSHLQAGIQSQGYSQDYKEDYNGHFQFAPEGTETVSYTHLDVMNMAEMLATRDAHEELTTEVAGFLKGEGFETFTLSTESCDLCEHCAYLDGKPCRFPEKRCV